MRPAFRSPVSDRPAGRRRLMPWLVAALAATGCEAEPKVDTKSVSDPPIVTVVKPPVRKIVRAVGQPSFVEAYEHTSIYPKMTAYVEKWVVDIGDKVKKGDLLATLFVPETVQDFQTKKADVVLAKTLIDQALKMDEVAEAKVKAAKAHLDSVKDDLARYQSEVDRWAVQVNRLTGEVRNGVVDRQILLEATNQLRSNESSRDAAKANIVQAQADLVASEADAGKSKVDVGVARARLAVAESDAKRLEAWVGYLTLAAPFDGVIVARNVNTGDFVVPASGDLSADRRSPDESTTRSAPLYVVDRIDVVRVFVDVPEQDADFVKVGTKATVLARAYRDSEIPASVTRTAWALNVKSRTLRAEIDLPNTDSRILPGMYAYGKIIIERPDVRALPMDALVYSGERTYVWALKDGKATRLEVETGINDGDWVEVTNRRAATGDVDNLPWTPVDGTEQVILGDLSVLSDGSAVKVAPEPAPAGAATASAEPPSKATSGSR